MTRKHSQHLDGMSSSTQGVTPRVLPAKGVMSAQRVMPAVMPATGIMSTVMPGGPQAIQMPLEKVASDFKFKHPFTLVIAGPTMSGKSVFTKNLIQNLGQWVYPCPRTIVWCYAQWQPLYQSMNGVEFVKGIPHDLEDDRFFDPNIENMIILDDLQTEAGNDPKITHLYTRGSHH